MTTVRIYQPSQTAMQSGKGKTKHWMVEYETKDPNDMQSLLWDGLLLIDTRRQLHFIFRPWTEAIQYAKLKGLRYVICNPSKVSIVPKSYGIQLYLSPGMRAIVNLLRLKKITCISS